MLQLGRDERRRADAGAEQLAGRLLARLLRGRRRGREPPRRRWSSAPAVMVPPETMESVGRFAVLNDPTGAAFGISPEPSPGASASPAAARRRPCARSARRRRGSGRSARRASRSGARGRSPAGACSSVSTPPSTFACMKSNSARQISSTWLGGAPPFRYGSKLNWKCTQSSSSKHIGSSQNRASRPRSSGDSARRPGRRSAGGKARSRRSSGSSRRGTPSPRSARASPRERSAEGRAEAERHHADPLQHAPGALHVAALLLARLAARVDVRVGVVRDLVAGGEDRLGLGRERLDRVAGDEEGRLDPVAVEQLRGSAARRRGRRTRRGAASPASRGRRRATPTARRSRSRGRRCCASPE